MSTDAISGALAFEGAAPEGRAARPPLLALSDPARPLAAGLLEQAGGFAWWYVDLLDPNGDGFVIIWSFGLPFLPGYLAAARAARPEPPRARPSLNVALYRGGRPSFYLLQEYSPEEAEWQPAAESWRFGASRISSRVEGGVRTVSLDLRCPVPRMRAQLRGEVLLTGATPRLPASPRPDFGAHHEWSPLVGPARCRASFAFGAREAMTVEGLAYHDRNGGDAPLDRLGIAEWTWGRAVDRDALLIYYVLWPEGRAAERDTPLAWATRVAPDGAAEHVAGARVLTTLPARATYGMRYHPELQLFDPEGRLVVRATTEALVDDGPFYLRTLATVAQGHGAATRGYAEWVRPARVDLARHRPFVRMRVHRTQGGNSLWLPLFSGPRGGRLGRLLGLGRG